MNRIFAISPPFRVPDGTWVSPFLNAKDSESDLPFDLLSGFSLAAGMIEPKSSSSIHIMPFVIQVTYVRSGSLTVKMKGPQDAESYTIELRAEQAVLTEPGTYFQLINQRQEPCMVLYIVSPAYTFDLSPDGRVRYDDSLVVDEDWQELAMAGWTLSRSMPSLADREVAAQRIATRKASLAVD